MSAISSLSFEEHAEALQAKDRLLDALRNMSSGIRSDARSLDDIMAPGRAVAREQRAQSIFKELSTDINKADETMRCTCQSLDEQNSLKGTIQKLRRCQAADEPRMEQLLKHITDLGVETQALPSASSWRIQAGRDAEATASPGTEDHTLNKPERTLSPQRPAYHQEHLATYGPSLQQSNFNVHESPAMGLLGPASNHAAACADVPGTHSALGSTASLHSLSHSASSVQPKPTVLQESHRHPRTEATLLSMAPSSACTEGGLASAGAPALAGGRPGSGHGPTGAGTLEQSEHATLSEHPSMRSPFVGRPGPASAAFTPIAAAPEPKHSAPSSFVQNLKLSEAKQTPEKDCSEVKHQNDMIADVLARHNIRLKWKGK